MSNRTLRTLTLTLAALITATAFSATAAQAAPASQSRSAMKLPKWKPPKIDLDKIKPEIKFVPAVKHRGGSLRLALYAHVKIMGKTNRLAIFDMAVTKTKKSFRVNRKVGKLSVSLLVSWEGTRTLTISGTARYLKFKIPVPRLRVRV
jgi:hypothetical protein